MGFHDYDQQAVQSHWVPLRVREYTVPLFPSQAPSQPVIPPHSRSLNRSCLLGFLTHPLSLLLPPTLQPCPVVPGCATYSPGLLSNKPSFAKSPDGGCWGASWSHSKNQRAGPAPALAVVGEMSAGLPQVVQAHMSTPGVPRQSITMDRPRPKHLPTQDLCVKWPQVPTVRWERPEYKKVKSLGKNFRCGYWLKANSVLENYLETKSWACACLSPEYPGSLSMPATPSVMAAEFPEGCLSPCSLQM